MYEYFFSTRMSPFFRICNAEAVNISICNAGMNDVRLLRFHFVAIRDCRRLLVFGSSLWDFGGTRGIPVGVAAM